jgi:cold shock CspA family protein
MSEQAEVHQGVVLWYRAEKGQGAVKADSGRHFRFDRVDGVHDVSKGLRVQVKVDASTTPPEVVLIPLANGRREFGPVPDATPKPKPKPTRQAAAPRTRTASASRPAAQSPGAGRRASRKIAAPKKKLANGAFQDGTTVSHPVHGQGFIVMSTPKVARVRFMPSGEERQVRTADLSSLEGSK